MKTTGISNITKRLLGLIATALLIAVTLGACRGDSPAPPTTDEDEAGSLSIGFRVAAPVSSRTRADEPETNYGIQTEDGSELESTIDFLGGSYRVYFFDSDNNDTYITTWSQVNEMHVIKGINYWTYEFTGKVPEALKNHTNFKVMVVANWQSYPEYNGIPLEGKTISQVVTATWSQFTALDNFELSIESGRLIPFYGLKEYTDITFEENQTRDLGDINLVRAMAKVEIIFKSMPDATILFDSPVIKGVNSKGYCGMAPNLTTGESEGYSPDKINLIDGINETEALNNEVRMYNPTPDTSNSWIAYIPEFRNINYEKTDEFATIIVKLKTGDEEPRDFILYFSKYDKYGESANSNMAYRFDIVRNYWYKYTLVKDEVGLNIVAEVKPYGEVELEPSFGIPNSWDENPPSQPTN